MATLKEEVCDLLRRSPGLTDREITNALRGASAPQQSVNIACRALNGAGVVKRRKRGDGLIGNYLTGKELQLAVRGDSASAASVGTGKGVDGLSEDEIKQTLAQWLEADGWQVKVAWGRNHGIDIEAIRGAERWLIEAKGCGSRDAMRVNYFIGILGETLQRMNDPKAKYSIALPDMPQFRRLWERLPGLAKERTRISAIFVDQHGLIIRGE